MDPRRTGDDLGCDTPNLRGRKLAGDVSDDRLPAAGLHQHSLGLRRLVRHAK